MKRHLQALPADVLERIASDLGTAGGSRTTTITRLAEYFACYGLAWPDVAARWQLPAQDDLGGPNLQA